MRVGSAEPIYRCYLLADSIGGGSCYMNIVVWVDHALIPVLFECRFVVVMTSCKRRRFLLLFVLLVYLRICICRIALLDLDLFVCLIYYTFTFLNNLNYFIYRLK